MKHEEKTKKTNVKQYALLVLVGLLFIFSVVQTIQIQTLETGFEEHQVQMTTVLSVPTTSAPAPTSTPRQAAPSMVGGC